MMTDAGELCHTEGRNTLYQEAAKGRGRVIFQAYSKRMIEATYTFTVDLG